MDPLDAGEGFRQAARMQNLTDEFRRKLVALVDRFQRRTGMPDSTISRGAFPTDSGFVLRLRSGENITLAKAGLLEEFLWREMPQRIGKVRPGNSASL